MVLGSPKKDHNVIDDVIDKVRNPEKIFLPHTPIDDITEKISKVIHDIEHDV